MSNKQDRHLQRDQSGNASQPSSVTPESVDNRALRALLGAFVQAVWETDAEGRVVADSPSWRAYTGQSVEEWLGYGWVMAVHPDDREYAERQWREIVANEEKLDAEFRLKGPDGGWHWTNVRAAPVRDDQGQIIKWFGVNIDISENKQALQELDRQHALLEGIYNSLPVLLVQWDDHLHKFTLNRHTENVLGWTTQDANEGDFMEKAYPDKTYRTVVTSFMQCLEPYWREWYTTAKNGSAIPIEWTNVRITDELSVGIGVDLRERKKVEQALRESEQRLQAILEQLPAGVGMINTQGEFILANSQMRHFAPHLIPSQDHEHQGRWQPCDKNGEPLPTEQWPGVQALAGETVSPGIEMRFTDPSGQVYWFEVSMAPFRDSDMRISGAVAVLQDITQSKTIEQTLQENEQRQRIAAEAAGLGLFEWQMDKDVLIWSNDRIYEILGISLRDDPVNMQILYSFMHPEDVDGFQKTLTESKNSKKVFHAQTRIRKISVERWFWIEFYGRFFYDEPNHPTRLVGTVADITDRIRAEREIREAKDELEIRVHERTLELQQQTQQLQRLAQELVAAEHRERKRLAAVLHDELQQDLVALRMNLQQTLSHSLHSNHSATLKKCLELADNAIDSSRNLTQHLRPPVLYENGLLAAIRWLAKDMSDRHDLLIEIETTHCRSRISESIRAMMFDSVRELLFNIVKHAETKKAMIRCYEDPDHFSITVQDEGKGFDPKTMVSPKQKPGGLGLFSIRERMLVIGGKMHIDSAPGNGSRITLEWPKKLDEDFRESVLEDFPSPRPLAPTRDTLHTLPHVLVVDDSALIRQGLVMLLKNNPDIHIVGEASDGVKALSVVEKSQPDVILMDVNLPNLNGIQVTRLICKLYSRIKVIGLSVQDDPATRQSMLEAGAAGFISKSASTQDLIDTILNVYHGKRL